MDHVWLKTVKRGAHAVLDCKTHVHLKKAIWGRCTEVRRSSPWNDLIEQPLKREIFVEAILKRIRPLPLHTMTKEPYFHIGIINLVQTLKNDRVHKKNDTQPEMSFQCTRGFDRHSYSLSECR